MKSKWGGVKVDGAKMGVKVRVGLWYGMVWYGMVWYGMGGSRKETRSRKGRKMRGSGKEQKRGE